MSAGHSVHLAYEPQHRFTLQPQHQVPPTSHTPATTLIEMRPPLPTPLIQLQAPHKPHLIKCGRPIRTPAAHTSLFTCISNTPPTLTDVTPCMTSYTVGTPFSTATSTVTVTQLGSSDVTQATAAKHTTNVTRTEIVCRNNTPVTSVTPASVLPSTNTANNSTTRPQVATSTLSSVVNSHSQNPLMARRLGKPTKNIMRGFAQLMVGVHNKRKLRT